jgi:hypothetical protein
VCRATRGKRLSRHPVQRICRQSDHQSPFFAFLVLPLTKDLGRRVAVHERHLHAHERKIVFPDLNFSTPIAAFSATSI